MRAKRIVDRLPEFTPAFLDIAELEGSAPRAMVLNVDENEVRELDELDTLCLAYQAALSLRNESHLERYNATLLFALGAIEKLSKVTDELKGKRRLIAGDAVKSIAPFVVGAATNLKSAYFETTPHPKINAKIAAVIRRTPEEIRDHIRAHAVSYRTLSPLMEGGQRRAIREPLMTPYLAKPQ